MGFGKHMHQESALKDVVGAVYGVAEKVGWLRDSVATKRTVQSLWADIRDVQKNLIDNYRETKIELGGITQSVVFIKDNSVTKEEFQSLRRELFDDIAFMKRLLSKEVSTKMDSIIDLYKQQEASIESLMVRQDCFDEEFDEFDDLSF